jgi:tetratricopeptide (TPR) repeat protein
MLSTIHEYALEKLKTCEDAPNIYQHYVQYFLHLVKSVSDNFQSFAQMEQEYPNIRAALEWLYRQGDKETLAQFGALLWPFWESHHHLSEGRHWLHIMLQSTELPASLRGEVLIGVGALAGSQGDYAEAHRLFEESLKLWKSMDQSDGIATSLVNLGIVASRQGNYTRAVDFYEEAMPLYDPLRNRLQIANLLCNQGITELDQGHYDHAWSLFAESQQLLQEVPDADIETMANIRMNLGRLAMHRGSHEEAQAHLEESLSAFRQSGDQRSVAFSRLYLGDVVYIKDGPIQAASFYSESLHYFHQVYDLASMGECLERLASVAAALEQPEIATQLYGVVAAMRRSITVPQPPAHRSRHDQIKADIRLRLGDESFDSAWNIGQRMCLDDIFDLLKNLRRTELAAPDSTSSHLEEQGGNG